jgi:O-antigen ligase/thioredoxin-like negative regulator of GroEL
MKDILKAVTYAGIFAVPFTVLLVTSSMFFPYITGKNFTFRILVEIVTASWVLLALLDAKYRPRFSWIPIVLLIFLGVMFVADLLGQYPHKSFWSNYERMEGYITLVHFALYFLIVSSMLTTQKLWQRFFNVSLSVAVLVCFFAFAQLSGAATISQGGTWRVDSTLGNSTYMAVYMIFHIFIAALMALRSKAGYKRMGYGALIVLFAFMIFQTGTRGAVLGLLGSGVLMTLYLVLFAHGHQTARRFAAGGLVTLILLVGGFMMMRTASFVENTPILARMASISLEAGDVRFMVWREALEGVKERPVLGWGQENFSYVFNKYYNPDLYRAEAWYDRTHNVILDWLIAGGVLGLLAYLALFASAMWYAVVRPVWDRMRGVADEHFTVPEQALLLGLFAAYFVHNLFVFDNIVSYIFFAVMLAFIHVRVSSEIPAFTRLAVNREIVEKVAAPVVGVVLVVLVYMLNVPSMLAAGDIIDAFKAQTIDERFGAFDRALSRGGFGQQEITEQISEQAMNVLESDTAPKEVKQKYGQHAIDALNDMIDEKPGDPRFYIFLAGIYRAAGQYDKAAEILAEGVSFTPTKVAIIVEQGVLELQQGHYDAMAKYFKETYDLAPDYERGRLLYIGALLYTGETEKLPDVLTEPYMVSFVENSVIFLAISNPTSGDALGAYLKSYVAAHPESTDARTAYALLLTMAGKKNDATAVLEEGVGLVPTFRKDATCFESNIASGSPMLTGCRNAS